ncbi:CRP-like cAMP-binding protein [Dyadobacter sp. BE34]|uniref:CRP-like cAMP-binding protein n=1 Tax=Dyadobacter fermentans TaxID=94254 RepID=A0ABU1QWC6_9BACT|nr:MULTISPECIES: Crp/Fnr family transcriptional regulator [Dyadobacter]MDR6805025.1 CRP-like cAMP-binding protein [Dyadobacter fermentans]MDR7043216.1 CRP-like cAMP-binding protein [Dyadobacter sp. BE242]MDR7197528.1 CRP-like cAMP-binding protein [Dyadobacter sp. BE34]MDR7215039.1 CRP-like cAMP-binding protein [Dyadobacter sp. BE31]MDR7262574.1 CRP-like cAMP-binding protein [Dyadobacter sp. BE32]
MNTSLLLQNIGNHVQLDAGEAEFLLSLFQPKVLKRKAFLLRQGEVCRSENFIVKGCVKVYSLDENGFEHILMFGIEGWWVGDLLSFLTGRESRYHIEALEDTELLQITKPDLDLLYERVPKMERFFRILLQNAFIAHMERINQSLSLDAAGRYGEFIRKYPAFGQRIPQKQIAAYLGITPVFLSMLRKKLMEG